MCGGERVLDPDSSVLGTSLWSPCLSQVYRSYFPGPLYSALRKSESMLEAQELIPRNDLEGAVSRIREM